MGIADIRITDIYFTIDGRVLLSINGELLSLERVVAPESADFLRSILTADGSRLALNEIAQSLVKDSQHLYDLARARPEASGDIRHDGCIYYFSRAQKQKDAPDALFHLRRLEAEIPDLAQLGLSPNLIWHMEQACARTGLVLAAGLAAPHRAACLSSLLNLLLRTQGKLAWTFETLPSYGLAGFYNNERNEGYCVQTRFLSENGEDHGASIRAAARAQAHYVLIDDILTPECAAQILMTANSGHLVLASVHGEMIPSSLSLLAECAASILGEGLARSLMARGLLLAFSSSVSGMTDKPALFAGSADSAVRGRIKAGKWALLASDVEYQIGRIRQGQPLFV